MNTTTLPAGGNYKTVESLHQMLSELVAPPDDPLNGATMLWCNMNDAKAIEAAEKICAASHRPIRIQKSMHAMSGRIYGFKGPDFLPVLVIKLGE